MEDFLKLLPDLIKASVNSLSNPTVAVVIVIMTAISAIAFMHSSPR